MSVIGKVILTVLIIVVFSSQWYSSYKLFKHSPIDKALKLISIITVLCMLGIVGLPIIIWCA